VVSAGAQYKGINRLPLRVGYTFSSNPISEEVTFFNAPATAIIKNAYQFGFSFEATKALHFDMMYHHGQCDGDTSGKLLNPNFVSQGNPMGAIPGSNVSYQMTTDLLMAGVKYQF
jgi:long-chain fatty acid transport protein